MFDIPGLVTHVVASTVQVIADVVSSFSDDD
jgi:hypothetical protein